MENVTEHATETQAVPFDITERATEPPPPPKPVDRVTYEAKYADYKVGMEIGGYSSMVSAYRRDPNQGFTGCNPPWDLLEPAFAAWLKGFLAECQRRYEARNAEGRS